MFTTRMKSRSVSSSRASRLAALLALGLLLSTWPRVSQAIRALSPGAAAGVAHGREKSARDGFVPGEALVRFRADAVGGSKRGARQTLTLNAGGRELAVTVERLTSSDMIEGLHLARVEPAETLAAIAALRERPEVLYAEPNYVWRKATLPNDPRFPELRGLRNLSSPAADIDAEQAWDTTTGSRNVVVGVIDEGIDVSHQDLRDNIWRNPAEIGGAPGVDDDGNGYVDDINGWDFFHNDASVYDGSGTNPDNSPTDAHGTHVAGTIGATGYNGVGVTGVNWQVGLLPLKFLGPDGGSIADAIRAYDYARTMRQLWDQSGGARGANIRVLNNSYGGDGRSQAALEAILALSDAGILFVAAAGNDARDNDRFPHYPSGYRAPNMVAVGAASPFGSFSSQFSNYGRRTVDLVAPGENILSTTPGNTYDFYSGTSMASPHAAGTAALVCAQLPNIAMRRLRAALVYGGAPGLVQFTSSGRRVNARGSLDNAAGNDTSAPAAINDLRAANQGYQRHALQWTAPRDEGTPGGTVALYEVRYSDTDLSAPAQFERATTLPAPVPSVPGAAQNITVTVPFRHPAGFIGVRAIDGAGNAGPVAIVNVNSDVAEADPYTVSVSGASESLTSGGTPLRLRADDQYMSYQLPFDFTFFGTRSRGITVSTNGALHFIYPSQLGNGQPDIDISGIDLLPGRRLIAGLWDDLRTDRRAGDDVYVVQPDPTRVIFRWQAVTYSPIEGPGAGRGEQPVNFEIELRRDGTIITRYGDGNRNLLPVVGLSGGEPDTYLIESHTSDNALKDLTYAPSITFTSRRPTPPPTPDLAVSIRTTPDPIESGRQLSYIITATNRSNDQEAEQVTVVNQLPAGVTFVSCTATPGACTGPPIGATGTVTAQLGRFSPYSISSATITITVQVTAPPGSTLNDTATISNYWNDSEPSNNTATVATVVQQAVGFANIRALSASGSSGAHTLALKTDGTVWAWGGNGSGQLGDDTTYDSIGAPTLVEGLANVIAVSAGSGHSLALKADGTVRAWGSNHNGQAGAQEHAVIIKVTPTQVAGLSGAFTAIAAGSEHSLALRSDGTVWAWGRNGSGELGNGAQGHDAYVPVQVVGLTGITAIAAGERFSMAVKADGAVWAWGWNFGGVLGLPSETFNSATPVRVNGIDNVASITAGRHYAIALKQDGTVWAWGNNQDGQLGNGGTGAGPTPRQVSGLTSVATVDAGGAHTLALKTDGTVWSWGRNSSGALGDGTTTNRNAPVPVNGLSSVRFVSGGSDHSGAVLPDGTVRMWGANHAGQLGDRTNLSHSSPVEVSGPPAVAAIVLTPDGGEYAFAQNVLIHCPTPGARIHYTFNGADPTEGDPFIPSNLNFFINRTLTLKARALKSGWPASPVKTASYVFPAATPTPLPTPHPDAVGQPIAFVRNVTTGPGGSDIFLMNPDGGALVNLTNAPGDDLYPSWSPDGTKLAFTSRREGGVSKVFIMNADGSGVVSLNNSLSDEGASAWSPDGTRIAYAGNHFYPGIYVVNLDGTNRHRITNQNYAGFPQWSPDGQSIIYTVSAAQGEIWLTRLDGSSAVRLTNNSVGGVSPVFSPDGTKIAFSTNRDEAYNYEIYVMNADGSNPVRLTNSPGWDRSPAWSPDGSKLIFESQRDGLMNAEIYLMNADGSNQTRLTNTTTYEGSPVWRPHPPATLQLSNVSYRVAEGAGAATLTVTRTGNTNTAVSVEYATIDDPAPVRCDTPNGTAYARCDYATTVDTLTFAPGETTKIFTVPLFDDAHVEGDETMQIRLSAPIRANLSAQRAATVIIADNDAGVAPNPINVNAFFVRQQYLDFLSREPEPSGLQAWMNVLNNCPDVNNDPACDRNTVSSSFFRSQEFQLKGYFVYRFYRVSLNRLPAYAEVIPDMRRVTGQTPEEVVTKRTAFANAWAQRPDFRVGFDGLTNEAFINRLLQNVGLQQLTGAVTRDTLLSDLQANRQTRAEVLRAIVEHPDVDAAEYRGAFVAMQYFGFLRRDPEPGGFNNWLNYLNSHPEDFRTMVHGFMNSVEYRLRFGAP